MICHALSILTGDLLFPKQKWRSRWESGNRAGMGWGTEERREGKLQWGCKINKFILRKKAVKTQIGRFKRAPDSVRPWNALQRCGPGCLLPSRVTSPAVVTPLETAAYLSSRNHHTVRTSAAFLCTAFYFSIYKTVYMKLKCMNLPEAGLSSQHWELCVSPHKTPVHLSAPHRAPLCEYTAICLSIFLLMDFCCFPGFPCVKLIWMEKDNVMCLPRNVSKGWPQRQESDSRAVEHTLSYCCRNWVETLGTQQINMDPTVTLPLGPWSNSFLNFWTVQTLCVFLLMSWRTFSYVYSKSCFIFWQCFYLWFFLTSLICGLDSDPVPATGRTDTSPQGPVCRMDTGVNACRRSSLGAEAGGLLESRRLRPAQASQHYPVFF